MFCRRTLHEERQCLAVYANACRTGAVETQLGRPAASRSGPRSPSRGKSEPSAARAFDDLVTADALFAPSDRPRLERTTSTGADGRRTYNFVLHSEPSMVPDRHFYMLTVVVARAGVAPSAQVATAAGPNGAFVERQLRTSDGAFDLTLRLGSRAQPPPTRGPKCSSGRGQR